jgi:nucleoside-diphosphate-sugar epimerase
MANANNTSGHRTRVLVTGAGGFIGTALVQRLASLGMDVAAVSRRPGRLDTSSDAYRFFSCDLRSPEQVTSVIAQTRPQLVYHLAASLASRATGARGTSMPRW